MAAERNVGKIKRLLAKYGRQIGRHHLVMGAMGNTSARIAEKVWIKRGGAWLEQAQPDDFVAVDLRSGKPESKELPSKEVFLHLGCYRARADIQAVVHTHPVMATALATAGFSLNRKCAVLPYYVPGSKKLARAVQRAIKKKDAVLLAKHGLVTVGKDIQQAYQRTLSCEREAAKILKETLFYLKKRV